MPLPSRSLQLIGAATPNRTFKASMFSSSFRATGRNHWRRGFCERAPAQGYEGSSEVDGVVSGDSHVGDVRAANYGHRQGYAHQQYRPWRPSPPPFRTGPPPRSADHRNWIFASSQPTPDRERFKVLSYNILADYLALDHQSILYTHIPNHILSWEWRKRRLFIEFGLWSPDIMCLQEVDQFCDLEGELAIRGYSGVWKMRTGNAVDGCAIFWRTNRFQLRHEESIEFSKLGLRDNVAQICVLESKMRFPENAGFHSSFNPSSGANQVVVCNTHVLYNPKRGEIKLGQVRILLDRAFAISRAWNDAPVIVCGDFNSIPMSPLYKFIATQKLNFSGLARNQISGQYSATLPSRPNSRYTSYRPQTFNRYASESRFGAQGGYCKMGPDNQHNMENSPPIEKSAVTLCQDVEQKVHRQMPSGASSLKLGESEIFSHHGGEQSSYLEFANKPSRTSEFCRQQGIIHANIDTDKNREEAHQNILDEPCSEGHKVSSGSADLAGEIKPTSTSSMNNSIAYFHSYQTESSIVGNAPFCHSNKDDLSTMDSSEADDTLSEEKPCTSCASNLSRGEILEEIPVLNPNLSRGADSTQNSQYSELSGLDEHEDRRSSEVFNLEENGDPNFFEELLGVEDGNQSVKDVNSPDLELQEKYSFPLASDALNVGRHFYDPYCWSPMEMEVASGNAKCAVVEHPLKLRSVYTDVEDYTGTKDSSREPQVTSYNQQFMGTVDYIWCSEDLQTVKVLDTIPKHVLQRTRGFPTQKWGSDHIALACELAFSKGSQNK